MHLVLAGVRLLYPYTRISGSPLATTAMKRFFWQTVEASGLLRAWCFSKRRCIPILSLHGVGVPTTASRWAPLWTRPDVEDFEATLTLLKQHFNFVSMSDAVAMLDGSKPVEPHSIVLTLDDGYVNNFTRALPVLRRLNIPAVFFVSTGYVGTTRSFWLDRLDFAIQQLPLPQTIWVGKQKIEFKPGERRELSASFRRLRLALKALYTNDVEFVAACTEMAEELEAKSGRRLADVLESGDDVAAVMTWEQCREALQQGIEIGSHTVDHLRLAHVSDDMAFEQLVKSKQEIESRLGRACPHIAYPGGSHSPRVAELAAEAGYTSAVTTRPGLNAVGADLFTLRRLAFPGRGYPAQVVSTASGLKHALGRV